MKRLIEFGLVSLFTLISFCSAGSFTVGGTTSNGFSFGVPSSSCNVYYVCEFSNFSGLYEFSFQGYNYYMTTSQGSSYGQYPAGVNINQRLGTLVFTGNYSTSNNGNCLSPTGVLGKITAGSSYSVDWSCTVYGDDLLISSSPQYTSEECQSEYGLITTGVLNLCISDLDNCQSSITGYNNSLTSCSNNLNNCTTNLNNCLVSNCGEVQWSALYINQIQHVSAPIINIDIPEEYNRTYTGDDNTFDLTVEGYNVDYEYIDNIITTQKSTPNSVDFNNIVSGLIPLLIPGLVIILFLGFIFRFVKKIF